MAAEVVEEYKSSLADLTFNSKPLINMLTMLAEENAQYAPEIVKVIEGHINQVRSQHKLPCVYLIDSIIKNLPKAGNYKTLITQDIVSLFAGVFEQVDEKTRQAMFKLRQTWSDIFPNTKMYALDLRIQQIDPAWPIIAQPPESPISSIHVNPKFLMKQQREQGLSVQREDEENELRRLQDEELIRQRIVEGEQQLAEEDRQRVIEQERIRHEQEEAGAYMRQQLLSKQQELMKVQQQRLELELAEAKAKLEQQAKQLQIREQLLKQSTVKRDDTPAVSATDTLPEESTSRDPRLTSRDPRKAKENAQMAVVAPSSKVDNVSKTSSPDIAHKASDKMSSSHDVYNSNRSSSKGASGPKTSTIGKKKIPVSKSSSSSARKVASPNKPRKDTSPVRSRRDMSPTRTRKDTLPNRSRKNTKGRKSWSPSSEDVELRSELKEHKKSPPREFLHGREVRERVGKRQYRSNRSRSESPVDLVNSRDHQRPSRVSSAKGRSRSRSPHHRSPRNDRSPRSDIGYDEDSREGTRRRSRELDFEKDRASKERERERMERDGFEKVHRDKAAHEKMEIDRDQKGVMPRNHARRGGRPARSGRDRPVVSQAKIGGSKSEGKQELGSDSDDNVPPSKRPKQEEDKAQMKELLDGGDQDYRKLPPIPKLNVSRPDNSSNFPPIPSPSAEGWARFKASRPEDFPFAQPRQGDIFRTPLRSPVGGSAPTYPRRTLLQQPPSSEQQTAGIEKPTLLDSAGDILIQAEEQLKSGKLTHEQHQELLKQLTELYKLQKIKQQLREEREKIDTKIVSENLATTTAGERQIKKGTSPDEKAAAAKAAYEEHATKLRAALQAHGKPVRPRMGVPTRPKGSHGLAKDPVAGPRDPKMGHVGVPSTSQAISGPRAPGHHVRFPAPRALLRQGGPGHFMPRGAPRPMRPRLGPPPGVGAIRPMESWEPLQYPWYDTDMYYVPQHDPRWLFKAREQEGQLETHELVIDGSHYEMPVDKPIKIPMGSGSIVKARIDADAREVLFGDICYYKIGDPERQVVVNGFKHTVFLIGPLKNIWIDGHQFEINLDSPPTKIRIGESEHEIRIDGFSKRLFADGFDICPFGDQPQKVKLAFIDHDIQFKPPPRHILIDQNLCELNLGARYPYVVINGKKHGIRFDGPAREVMIDNKPWTVPVDQPRRCRFSGRKPRLLALGGPGHELIINNNCYELKFGGPEKYIRCGDRVHKMQLIGNPPEVKILGEMKNVEEIVEIAGPAPPDHTSDEGLMLGYGTPSGPHFRPKQPQMFRPIMEHVGMRAMRPIPMGPPNLRYPPQGHPQGPMGPGGPPRPGMPPMSIAGPARHMVPTMRPQRPPLPPPAMGIFSATGQQPVAENKVDVNDLLSKLMMAGIIGGNKEAQVKEEKIEEKKPDIPSGTGEQKINTIKKEDTPSTICDKKDEHLTEAQRLEKEARLEEKRMEALPDIDNFEIKTLKRRYNAVIQRIYVGIQCSSCGIRFTTEHMDKYQEHLDWHFRQNRREKDEMKVAKFRRWYYGVADWIQYEEIGDLDERQSSFFESMFPSEPVNSAHLQPPEIISCPAASGNENNDMCDVCREKFEQFFDEENEEWHLKDAIRVNDKTYHPVCYEDVKNNLSENTTPMQTPTPTEVPSETLSEPVIDPISDPLAYLNHLNALRAKEESPIRNTPVNSSEQVSTPKDDTISQLPKTEEDQAQNTVSEVLESDSSSQIVPTVDNNENKDLSHDHENNLTVDPKLIVIQPIKAEEIDDSPAETAMSGHNKEGESMSTARGPASGEDITEKAP